MWSMLSCTCDWLIQSLFSDRLHYLSVSYYWNTDVAGPIYIISSWFYSFFTFYLFFPKWLSAVMSLCNSLFAGCQQAEVHSHFLQISMLPAEVNSDVPPQNK